jgi:hypothetical protein
LLSLNKDYPEGEKSRSAATLERGDVDHFLQVLGATYPGAQDANGGDDFHGTGEPLDEAVRRTVMPAA